MQLRLRGVPKRGVDLVAVADAERVCQEAAKALVLARQPSSLSTSALAP